MEPFSNRPWVRVVVFLFVVWMAANWAWRTYQPVQQLLLTAERTLIPDGEARKGLAMALTALLVGSGIFNLVDRLARFATRKGFVMNKFDHLALLVMCVAELLRGTREFLSTIRELTGEWINNPPKFFRHAPRAAVCGVLVLCTAVISSNYGWHYLIA